MKINPVTGELYQADGRRDMTYLTVTFEFCGTNKNGTQINDKNTVSENKIYEVPVQHEIPQTALRNSTRSLVRTTGRGKNITAICTFYRSTGRTASHPTLVVGTENVALSSLHSRLPFQNSQ